MKMIDKGRLIEWADERWRQAWATQIADFNSEDDEVFKLYIIAESTRYNERAQVLSEIRLFPAVNIVRCKDCKHWQDQEEGVVESAICVREKPMIMEIGPYGYCSYGEMRNDEDR